MRTWTAPSHGAVRPLHCGEWLEVVKETRVRRGEWPTPHPGPAVAAAEAPQVVAGKVGGRRVRGTAAGPVEQSPWAARVEDKYNDATAGSGDACQLGQGRRGVGELECCDGDRGIRDGVRQWQAPGVGAHESIRDTGGSHREHPSRRVYAQHSGTPTGQMIDESASAAPHLDHHLIGVVR